jgi:hypothetical protein
MDGVGRRRGGQGSPDTKCPIHQVGTPVTVNWARSLRRASMGK